jgi:hypothetical protein
LEYLSPPEGVSDEFRNRLLRKALVERYGELWGAAP